MRERTPLSVLSSLAFSTLAIAAVPADPIITAAPVLPRQNNDRFIGFVQSSGIWYSETCNVGLTWYQDGKYGQCCPSTLASCYAPTACVSGSLIYPYSDKSRTTTIACTNNYDNSAYSVCNTAFIFENMQDSNPKTDIVCGESSVNWSYYRSVPASVTAKSSAASAISQPTSPAQPSSSSSKAWIAGAVVGPILGLALIGGLIWFFLRRRSRARAPAPMSSSNPNAPPAGVGGFTDAKPQFQPPAAPQGYAPQHYGEAPAPGYASGPQSPGMEGPQRGSEYYGGGAADAKTGFGGSPVGAAELGGGEAVVSNQQFGAPGQQQQQAVEMAAGETRGPGSANVVSELPGGRAM